MLVENRERVVGKDELMKVLWPDTVVEEGNLTQNISTLREVLGEKPTEHVYIATIPKQGYRFIAVVTETAAANSGLRWPGWLSWAALLAAVLGIAAGSRWFFERRTAVGESLMLHV